MREFDDQDAVDGDDSRADAVPEHADDARQARYEALPDAAERKACAIEYRQRVEATYAAYEAGDARPQEARFNHVPALRQDTPEDAAPSRDPGDAWRPSQADRDRVRKLYSDYLADIANASRLSGHEQGISTAGLKPDLSPGDVSGLPPPGDELTEMESARKSRFSELLREAEKEENLDGLHDAVEEDASTVQRWLSARPPEGHAEQPVPVPHPYITPWVPEHGIEGGNAASAVMVAGILTVHMARWIDDKLRHWKGGHDDGNG